MSKELARILSEERSDLMDFVKCKPAGSCCGCNDGLTQQSVVQNHTTIVGSLGRSQYTCTVVCGGGKTAFDKGQVSLVEIGFSVVGEMMPTSTGVSGDGKEIECFTDKATVV